MKLIDSVQINFIREARLPPSPDNSIAILCALLSLLCNFISYTLHLYYTYPAPATVC